VHQIGACSFLRCSQSGCIRQAALDRQDLSCTYLAHHEPEKRLNCCYCYYYQTVINQNTALQGDFIALTGSLSALPLDFVLVLAMTLKVTAAFSCCLLLLPFAIASISCLSMLFFDFSSVSYHLWHCGSGANVHNTCLCSLRTAYCLLTCTSFAMQVYGKSSPMWLNIINGTLCVLLFFVTCVSSISSVRYIVVDSVNYHVFAIL